MKQYYKFIKQYYQLVFLLLFPLLISAQPSHGKKVVGYYAQWSIYDRNYNIPAIDGDKLTHLNYAFFGTAYDPARPENTKLRSLDPHADFDHTEGGIPWDASVKGNFYDLMKLKQKYPHLKVLISIGGWTEGQDLSPIAANPVSRKALVADMVKFMTTYSFIDGFDIDWEYPVKGGTDGTEILKGGPVRAQLHSPDDHKNLVYLLKDMRQAMPNKLVTAALGNNVRNVPDQYIGPKNRARFGMTDDISTYCDYITYFGYDFGGNWYDKTCYNAPLYASQNPNAPLYGAAQSESLDELTNIYLNVVGYPANKLIMGIPFYGKIFNNVANNGTDPNYPGLFVTAPRDAVSGCNPQSPLGTWDTGARCENSGSIEICDLVGNQVTVPHPYLDPNTMLVTPKAAADGWVRYFDNRTKVPYLYNARTQQFISYEDKQSIDLKVQYLKSKNLAGGMIWELSQDTRGAITNSLLKQIDTSFGTILPGTVSISGSVKNGTNLITNVIVELRDSNDVVLEASVSPTGTFTFNNVNPGQNYTLTASHPAYTFTAVTLTNVTVSQTAVEIQGTALPTHTLSGTVKNGTAPVSGVVIMATSGTTSLSATSDASGNYTIPNLVAGLDYLVIAAKPGMTYAPASTIYTAINEDKTLHFTQNLITNKISGSVKNGSIPVSGAKVQLVLPWTDSTHGYQSIIATTDAQGNFSYDDSVLAGYSRVESLKLNEWENKGIIYFPTDLANFPIPATSQVYNFNSSAVAPQITITSPSSATVPIVPGTAIQFKANADLTFSDPAVTISSVVFTINGKDITGTHTTGKEYTASWTPTLADLNKNYTLKATATASNNTTAENTKTFYLECSGANCPNVVPEITWGTPTSNTINQVSGFKTIPISVDVKDKDGTVATVSISIDGVSYPMTKGNGSVYSYTFTPNAYKTYAIVVKATDNSGGENTLNQSITIINSIFNQLPPKVIVGYTHGWENTSAPFLYFNQLGDKKFNVIIYSFIETKNRDGFTPLLVVNEPRYMTNGVFDPQLLKNDIKFLRDKGIPVLVSIGGQNGHVVLQTTAQKDIFVNGVKAIVDQYHFDGVDIDFEGSSMNFDAGNLKDFSYASISAYPKLKNVVDAFKELKAHYGNEFILTAAPEAYYVQAGYNTYASGVGSFLPVIQNLRNELDLLMVQLYNTGSIVALDNVAYSQGTPDFLVSMSDMLLKGFNVANTGYHFAPLPASKVVIAIPACSLAAPAGGYLPPDKGIQAFDYLKKGISFPGRKYTLRGSTHPDMRGVMTWSVNWDAACTTGYEFSDAYHNYFNSQLSLDKFEAKNNTLVYFKNNALVITNEMVDIAQVQVFNILGQSLVNYKNIMNNKEILLHNRSFSTKQLFIVVVTNKAGNKKSFKVLNFLN
ncbi:glycosyl hydrolase family 18 protein [Flavobacterium poyangense]|uniref:glycosyl hydrolase family 18 protein n=1 Tax=Flavobacterium poyangense TaxID=2204302 RepID=UPI0027D30A4D|nr:glycosyl hydrolase family 18 protein [Flavobacterium sp. JXAS1]